MEYRHLGRTGIRVTDLCMGAMTFGREATEDDSRAMLDRYLEAGGNFVDTANVYAGGASEEILGRVFAERPGLRDDTVLATKVRMPTGDAINDAGASRRNIRASVERSLRRLQTDWIDLYQIHAYDPRTPLDETLSTLDDLVREGKVRYIGASNYAGWQLAKALGLSALHGWERFVALQQQYSLLAREIEREQLPLCREEGVGVLVFSPLAGGLLTGKYRASPEAPEGTRGADRTPASTMVRAHLAAGGRTGIVDAIGKVAADVGKTPAQVALNWVLTRDGVTSVILGARTVAQLDDNLAATGWTLDADHVAAIEDASGFDIGYPYNFVEMISRR
jgi:aryl-alcohol dehydrogenase-like predicted oxidoreductase